jgi:hypothetical protein
MKKINTAAKPSIYQTVTLASGERLKMSKSGWQDLLAVHRTQTNVSAPFVIPGAETRA